MAISKAMKERTKALEQKLKESFKNAPKWTEEQTREWRAKEVEMSERMTQKMSELKPAWYLPNAYKDMEYRISTWSEERKLESRKHFAREARACLAEHPDAFDFDELFPELKNLK